MNDKLAVIAQMAATIYPAMIQEHFPSKAKARYWAITAAVNLYNETRAQLLAAEPNTPLTETKDDLPWS
jgi:hypothetical protein